MSVLPLGEPLVRVYPHHAFLQAVLTLNETAYDWIFMNFVGLVNRLDYREKDCLYYEYLFLHSYDGCPFLDIHPIPRALLHSESNMASLLQESIQAGYYILLDIDEFDLPDRQFTGGRHLAHSNFLYGYEKTRDTFYVAYFDVAGKYKKGILSGKQLYQSLKNSGNSEFIHTDVGGESFINLVKGKANYGYRFEQETVYAALRDFLESKTPPKQIPCFNIFHNDAPRCFGLDTLRTYCVYLDDMRKGLIRFDKRNPYLVAEYMHLFSKRLIYMQNKKNCIIPEELIADVSEAERKAEISLRLCMRYMLTGNGQNLERARKQVEDIIYILEKMILP